MIRIVNNALSPEKEWKEAELVAIYQDHEGFVTSSDDELCVNIRFILKR